MPSLHFSRWISILLLLLTFEGLRAAPPEDYRFLPLTEAAEQAGESGKPMMLYFGRYGCTTCRKMHAEVFTDPDLRERLNRDFVLAYVDTESGNRIRLANGERTTEMQFATRNRIFGTPTFIFFSPQQQPLFKKAGFQSIEQMKQYAEFIAEGHYEGMSLADFLAKP
jgi:thioredoxin-related protein